MTDHHAPQSTKANQAERDMVEFYIMGKKYRLPSSLTVMKGFEYAGYTLLRGCGCRAGFCGACATVYRVGSNHELKVGLARQTKVEQDMYVAQIPFYPHHKVGYDLEVLRATADQVVEIYPEINKCLGCNSCTNVCPQDIKVMKYVSHAIRGEVSQAADESFDCLMCGLCASKCPANIVQYKVAILCRRLHSKYVAKKAQHLEHLIKQLNDGTFDDSLAELMGADKAILAEKYNQRDME